MHKLIKVASTAASLYAENMMVKKLESVVNNNSHHFYNALSFHFQFHGSLHFHGALLPDQQISVLRSNYIRHEC